MDTTRRAFLIGGGAAVVLAACGSDGDDASTAPTSPPDTSSTEGSVVLPEPTTTNGLDGELPPVEATDLEPLLGPRLAELGLVLTNRGGLIDTRNGQYLQSPNGNHVALYVEPVGDYTNDQFIDGIYEVTLLSAPTIFERWPAIESYDICQEPRAEDDPRPDPVPATQIFMTNEQSQAIDWDTVTTVDLIAGTLATPPTVDRLTVSQVIQAEPRYAQMFEEAKVQAGVA
ncbi:MAG TPA: hypothetical protein VMW08_17040 [Acidimicrobiales bacterium]|nr:hypothetical protein [Acidimicrobiales bacterium]